MLLMGDEVGRSQGGNNNSWCQDNVLSQMIWDPSQCDSNLYAYVRRLLKVRCQLADLLVPMQKTDTISLARQENYDLRWHGVEPNKPDWAHWSHSIAYSLNRGKHGAILWVGCNAYFRAMHFGLPKAASPWHCLINTALLPSMDFSKKLKPWAKTSVLLENRSLVVMLAQEYAEKLNCCA